MLPDPNNIASTSSSAGGFGTPQLHSMNSITASMSSLGLEVIMPMLLGL